MNPEECKAKGGKVEGEHCILPKLPAKSIRQGRKKNNPFKMWGSYVGMVIGLAFSNIVYIMGDYFKTNYPGCFDDVLGECTSIIVKMTMVFMKNIAIMTHNATIALIIVSAIYAIVGFIIGFAIHYAIRRFRK